MHMRRSCLELRRIIIERSFADYFSRFALLENVVVIVYHKYVPYR